MESQIATDDGTAGFHGPVTKCLGQWLDENEINSEETIIYACGPEAMLIEAIRRNINYAARTAPFSMQGKLSSK